MVQASVLEFPLVTDFVAPQANYTLMFGLRFLDTRITRALCQSESGWKLHASCEKRNNCKTVLECQGNYRITDSQEQQQTTLIYDSRLSFLI